MMTGIFLQAILQVEHGRSENVRIIIYLFNYTTENYI